MRSHLILLAICGLFMFACKDKILNPEEQLNADLDIIEKYLSDNNLTAQNSASGLHYIITEPGSGGHPSAQSTVTVKYKGYLTDGTVFDQTTGTSTASFPLANLIPAWQEGIPLLQKGGKGTFFCPSYLGYGTNGSGPIPPNSVLIFEIELVNF